MSEDRRHMMVGKRIAVARDATLVTSDGHALSVRLTEISLDGFKIAHRGEDLVVGELVKICDGKSILKAQIKWATSGEAGAEIVEPPKGF